MENENCEKGKLENIFYAALALNVAHKPINKENIRAVLRAAGNPVDEPVLDIMGAFIESLKVSHGQNDGSNDSRIIKLLTTVTSPQNGPANQLDALLGELNKAAAISRNKGRYVYGITAGGQEVKLGPIGIDGSEVYTIGYQDLGAIVHNCPPKPYQSADDETVKRWVKTHQSVLDAAKDQFEIIIPLGFDTILKPADDNISPDQVVRDWLKKDSDTFQNVIDQIEGKDEYAVQISYAPSVINKNLPELSQEAIRSKIEMAKKSPGIAYLYKHKLEKTLKTDMEKLTDEWFKDFFDRIDQHADNVIVEKTRKMENDKVMLLNLSCLVAKENVAGLGEELEKINNKEGFSVHFSGPWPPYSFVAGPNIRAAKQGPDDSH